MKNGKNNWRKRERILRLLERVGSLLDKAEDNLRNIQEQDDSAKERAQIVVDMYQTQLQNAQRGLEKL